MGAPLPPRGDQQADVPRPTVSESDALLRAVVVAWDLDDELAFRDALKAARLHTGALTAWPKTTIRRTES